MPPAVPRLTPGISYTVALVSLVEIGEDKCSFNRKKSSLVTIGERVKMLDSRQRYYKCDVAKFASKTDDQAIAYGGATASD